MKVLDSDRREADALRQALRDACTRQDFTVMPRTAAVSMVMPQTNWARIDNLLRRIAEADLENALPARPMTPTVAPRQAGYKGPRSVTVNTDTFTWRYGHRPAGHGIWYFTIANETLPFTGMYSAAKAAAQAYAAARNVTEIALCN